MVTYVLFANIGKYFTNTEIRAEVSRRFGRNIHRVTVSNALKAIEYSTGLLEEKTITVGDNKDVTAYSIIL